MNNIIYKYPLKVQPIQQLELPEKAFLMAIQMQNGQLFLWAAVDREKPLEKREFEMLCTGEEFISSTRRHYITTVLVDPFVFHVSEILK